MSRGDDHEQHPQKTSCRATRAECQRGGAEPARGGAPWLDRGPRTSRASSQGNGPDDFHGAASSLDAGEGRPTSYWLVDLGNPNQTERSGFTAASAKAGDAIVVLGNRHKDKSQDAT